MRARGWLLIGSLCCAAPVAAQFPGVGTQPPASSPNEPAPPAPALQVVQDRFTGGRWVYASDPNKSAPNLPGLGVLTTVFLRPMYGVASDGTWAYVWGITLVSDEWCFFDGGARLLVNGAVPVTLPSSMHPRTDVGEGGIVHEQFLLFVPSETMRAIATATLVEIRLSGTRRTIESQLRPEHLAQVKALLGAPALLGVDSTTGEVGRHP